MPLNPTAAEAQLRAAFEGIAPTVTEADMAGEWADAIETLATAIIPASTTVTAAASTLQASLAGFSAEGATAASLTAALTTFAVTVAGGMAGAGYSGIVPPSAAAFTFSDGDDAEAAAENIITTIDAWLKTGTATLIASPNTLVNWS